jgi:hypothetical protein
MLRVIIPNAVMLSVTIEPINPNAIILSVVKLMMLNDLNQTVQCWVSKYVIMLSDTILNVEMLSVIMMNGIEMIVIMLSDIMANVILLNVEAPMSQL